MIFFCYHKEPKEGNLNYLLNKSEAKRHIRSYFKEIKPDKSSYLNETEEYYDYLRISLFYNQQSLLSKIKIGQGHIFSYNQIEDICIDKNELIENLKKFNLNYQLSTNSIILEENKIRIYFSNENSNFESMEVLFDKNCGLTLLRLEMFMLPAKSIYDNLGIDLNLLPHLQIIQHDLELFGSFGRNPETKAFIQLQKNLVNENKYIEAIKENSKDIKEKTSSRYTTSLGKLLLKADEIETTQFIKKEEIK